MGLNEFVDHTITRVFGLRAFVTMLDSDETYDRYNRSTKSWALRGFLRQMGWDAIIGLGLGASLFALGLFEMRGRRAFMRFDYVYRSKEPALYWCVVGGKMALAVFMIGIILMTTLRLR